MNQSLRAALYCRVSTEEQAREGVSLEAQRQALVAFCRSQSWRVVDHYVDDGYSAATTERPRLKEMLQSLPDGHVDVVVVYRLDRLTRSVLDLYALLKTLEQHDVAFKSATEVFDTTSAVGRLFMTLVAALAQWEREKTMELTRMGKGEAARQGRWHGGPTPLGYRYDPNEADHLLIEPTNAETIRTIFDLYLDQKLGVDKIARELTLRGIQSYRGGKWYHKTVRNILVNPSYAGFVPHNGIRYEGRHEPIIPRERWELAQDIIKRRYVDIGKRSLLSGLLRCAECGGRMRSKKLWSNWKQVKKGKQKERRIIPYYACYNYLGRPYQDVTGKCTATYRRADVVEQNVIDQLRQYAFHPASVDQTIAESAATDDKSSEVKAALKKELADIDRRIKRWMDAFEQGELDISSIRDRLHDLEQRRSNIAQRIVQQTNQKNGAVDVTSLREQLKSLGPTIDYLTKEELRQVLELLVREIRVDRDGNTELLF